MRICFSMLTIFLILIWIIGCGPFLNQNPPDTTETKPVSENPESQYADGTIIEDFDVLSLRDDELDANKLKFEQKKKTEMPPVSQPVSKPSTTTGLKQTQTPAVDTLTTSRVRELVPGWRVQICALADESAARRLQQRAEDVFEKYQSFKVYLTYDSPYYKVRIGDFTSRTEADRLKTIAIQKGFPDAWVVRTNVLKQSDEFDDSEILKELELEEAPE
ncbi:SPOR domain-containing protein [candidate division KSB1 bacterium]|nr:SPOR domain-containing protein [candidate division KSB1 bacterium]